MRKLSAGRVEYQATSFFRILTTRWMQAGVFSFAYRLAHLSVPRPGVLFSLSLMFYLV
ncbi:hypothetical protein MNBD_ALPHA11-1221 [hydrothermal vent metagenome]|uniref:Uncharacterized protein n=1 Tax=hydrothermal vent metagenome TaxID=652676 RepID=A0A3B0U2L8_9ZZZZ